MAPKVHPHQILSSPSFSPSTSSSSTSSSSCYVTSEREVFTVWWKSLVFQGNGCTAFDSKGRIIYRVDNYDKKCCREVYLMDICGKVLFSIKQEKLRFLGQWVGYKWSDCGSEKQRWFQVRKSRKFLGGATTSTYNIHFAYDNKARESCRYKIVRTSEKVAFNLVDREGRLVAEAKPKQSNCGVSLGEDVLSLMVEPQEDHSLVMAIVTAYGSMNHRL